MSGHFNTHTTSRRGFTIVELLIVVVVIAILATITIIAFRGVQDQAKASSLKTTVVSAGKAIETAKIQTGTDTYPTSFPSNVQTSSGAILSLSTETNAVCVNGEIPNTTLKFYYSLTTKQLTEGVCPGSIISGSDIGAYPTIIPDVSFTNIGGGNQQWGTGTGGASSSVVTTRAGTASDPFPNRPVLVVTNTANAAVTWMYLRGPVDLAGITSGSTYSSSYYVRLASGTHTGTVASPGVMSTSATNSSLGQLGGAATPNGTWQNVRRSGIVASQNGVANTGLYMSLSTADARVNNFVLEFQGFEIRQN